MDTNFNHEQSLTLINEMIQRAQNNVKKGKTYATILMGYVVAAAAVTQCVLIHTLKNPNQSFLIWLVIIPTVVAGLFIERRDKREKMVKTHIDKIGDMVWVGYGIASFVFLAVLFTVLFRLETSAIFQLATPVVLIMLGMLQFILSCTFRRKIWYLYAACYWGGAVTCAFLSADVHLIVFAVCILLGFVMPGHILIHQIKKSHV